MKQQRKTYIVIFFPIILILVRIGEAGKVLVPNNEKHSSGQRFAMEPQDQTAIVGSRVTLPCRVIDKEGSLQWTKDDFGLGEHRNLSGFERYSMIGSDEEGDFSLDIYPVMLDDDARYQCQVGPGPLGQPGIRSRFAKITVLVPPEAPKIIQGDFLVTTEDREIELECISVGGKPAAEITWIDGLGNVLTKGIEYVKEPFADSRRFTAKSILKLTPKKEHHNTTFTCQAQNTADRTYRSAKLLLEVKYAPKVSVSVIGGALAGGRIPEGAEVRLSCHADANPNDINYKWYINDKLVVGDYTTEMIIHNVTRKYHDAIVKCEVYNAVGKSEESETLDISYGPVFRQYPKSVEADSGSTVSLWCDVDGNPPADIVWVNESSDKVVGTSPNLTITVTPETVGQYYCKASVMGFPEIGTEVTVYLKRPPTITSQRTQFGIIGDNAHIDCVAFSVPKAKHVSWFFNGREINVSSNQDYSVLYDPLSEGIKSTLIIRESQTKHFGRYNCTVINEYGNDTIEIEFIPQKSLPMLMVVVGSISLVAIMLMIIMIIVLYLKRGKKKLPPADIIPDHHGNEKACKESDRSSNISDIKAEIRTSSCEPDYSETCSGTGSIATRLASNVLGSATIGNGVRYSGDYIDNFTSSLSQQAESGQQSDSYTTYTDYLRDYSPPPQSMNSLRTNNLNKSNNAQIIMPSLQLNGQLPSGNLSLTRNRNDGVSNNDHSNPQSSMNSLSNGLLGQQFLQNGLSIDPRYSATYGNPYLRTSSTSLPPLPPPSTANPTATPAPPPYHQVTKNHPKNLTNLGDPNNSAITLVGNITSSSGLVLSNNSPITPQVASLTQQQQQQQQHQQQQQQQQSQQLLANSSGQFILPTNGNLKKGALATHVQKLRAVFRPPIGGFSGEALNESAFNSDYN